VTALEIGTALVTLNNEGREQDFVAQYYAPDIVSIEGQGSEEMPARIEGLPGVKGKHEWWYANHEVHSSTAEGPYVGHREDQFAVRFALDVTPTGGERMQMDEVALYTVRDGKIVQEEFLYRMG
jgi:ketosteroid isomerase-like protein